VEQDLHVGESMKKVIFSLLVLVILLNINILNVKANEMQGITVEVAKRNPDMVITGCNETYIYWKYNTPKYPNPVLVREANETYYLELKENVDYNDEYWLLLHMLAAKYNLTVPLKTYERYLYIESLRAELDKIKNELFQQHGDLGIWMLGVLGFEPITVGIRMYKITDEKVNIVLKYIGPFVKKYNALVFIFEDYFAESIYEKQREAVNRFYGYGLNEYLNLLKEYYNFTFEIKDIIMIGRDITLPIPKNVPFNEEFVKKTVSVIRKYAGCEVPLVVSFAYDYVVFFQFEEAVLYSTPNDGKLLNPKPAYPSLPYLILLFVVIPIAILLPLVLLLRKGINKKGKN
jgi:hypothetical protein